MVVARPSGCQSRGDARPDGSGRAAQAPSDRRMRRRLTRCSEPRSGRATNSVSSPAIEPATSGQRARSRAAAMAWAEPGSVRRTSSRPASWISSGRSARSLRRRSSPDVSASTSRGGRAYAVRPVAGDLDEAQLGDVAGDRRLGRPEPALAQGGGQLLLGPDGPLADEVADRPLAGLLHDFHRRRHRVARNDEDERRPARTGRRRRSSSECVRR